MIQEPQMSLCFSQGFNNHGIQTLSNKVGFEPEKTKAAKLAAISKASIDLPFPHFEPVKFTTNQR
ncbi:hypothetical protein K6U70_09400 [Vibrio vulnificus]|uniref:hypothetical protein n=1 Tax=Vibrio vulnificus TaxID=672 RepID=UPI001EEA275F|nr:hypothetical protein [Vibrio vulnificus]MCG6272371.1 hypothetical protein [Vibrio vulnificus]